MGYALEFNCLLVVPDDTFDRASLRVGSVFAVAKRGERLYPLNIAIEFCDASYRYIGKVAVRRLVLESGQTTVECEVLKLFSPQEAAVYTATFIPTEDAA
jgi:hypothetical protein